MADGIYTTGQDAKGNWYVYNKGLTPYRTGMLYYGDNTNKFDELKSQLNLAGGKEQWEGYQTPAPAQATGRDTEQPVYDDQIGYINGLLGNLNTQRDAGLNRLEGSYGDAKNRLNEQKQKTMAGYDEQSLKNTQQRGRGLEQVDQFANNSYNSLQRLLAGAGAGNSSVGRELVPMLVSQSAGARRQGVIDTAGENEAAIANARKDAETEYGYSFQDMDNQYRDQRKDFLAGLLGQEQDYINKRMQAEAAKAAASGAGYAAARAATAQSRADLDNRTAQLNSLFAQYAPSFTARATNLKGVDLAGYQVDPALIGGDQSIAQQNRYYLPQIRKREEEL